MLKISWKLGLLKQKQKTQKNKTQRVYPQGAYNLARTIKQEIITQGRIWWLRFQGKHKALQSSKETDKLIDTEIKKANKHWIFKNDNQLK